MASIPTLQPAEAFIRYIYASRYITYSTFCLLIYDHSTSLLDFIDWQVSNIHQRLAVLTFADELNLVWQSRSMNSVKAMFIFNRYAVPVILAVDVARTISFLYSLMYKDKTD